MTEVRGGAAFSRRRTFMPVISVLSVTITILEEDRGWAARLVQLP
jgi:hypothetical protein